MVENQSGDIIYPSESLCVCVYDIEIGLQMVEHNI